MFLFRYILFLSFTTSALAQTTGQRAATLTGRVADERGRPLPGANVYLRGTYDGANADSAGRFSFTTSRKDTATLLVSFVGYEPFARKITLAGGAQVVNATLREAANELNTVVIAAGTFEASDERRMTMLKPMDIVTTAGGGADIASVMQLLPGAQRAGEQTGLFIRGGSAQEARVLIDGMAVQNPYFSNLPNLQSRGRFDPFMFKGTAFSTGGYSAQYGQALSGVLLLNTTDKGENNGLSVGLNLVSANVDYSHATERMSIAGTAYYGNLRPLFLLAPSNVAWSRVPEFSGGSLTYRLKTGKTGEASPGLLKAYGMYSDSWLGLNLADPVSESGRTALTLRNRNAFATTNYTTTWDEGRWALYAGATLSRNRDRMTFDGRGMDRADESVQGRVVLTRTLGSNSILIGTEGHVLEQRMAWMDQPYALRDRYVAAFSEAQIYLSRALAAQVGVRVEYTSIIGRGNLSPRLSLAYKTGPHSQVALAAGQFYQTPDTQFLYMNTSLNFERADHLILNYQRQANGRTFRVEAYYKNYAQLVREQTSVRFDANPYRFPWGQTTNTGHGYAQGFDLFWRDQKSIKNFDYWLTYSYVDSRRLAGQFALLTQPLFVSNHNASVITKTFVPKLRLNVGATYTFTSGRPYFNPNRPDELGQYMADRTPTVHNVALSFSHVRTVGGFFTIFYATVDNVLNSRQVFTYQYTPDGKQRFAVGPQTFRSFFVGGIIMLSKKAKVDVKEL